MLLCMVFLIVCNHLLRLLVLFIQLFTSIIYSSLLNPDSPTNTRYLGQISDTY